jgi:hypothetical protein
MRGIGYMLIAIALLIIPGMIFNNLHANALTPAAGSSVTCPGYPDVTCQILYPSGCTANANYCTTSGQTISLLNQNSPFTSLLTFNVLGFFSSLLPPNLGTTIYTAQPQFPLPIGVGATNQDAHGVAYCINLPADQTVIKNPLSNWIYNCSIYSNTYPASSFGWAGYCPGSDFPGNCADLEMVQSPGTTVSPTVNNTAFYVSETNIGAPPIFNGANGYYIFGSTLLSTSYNATYTYKFALYLYGTTQTSSGANPLSYLSILGWVVGIAVLILLALGISFEAGALTFNFGISNNRQGTKFAQVLLVGLVVYIPLYSEFAGSGSWLDTSTVGWPFGIATLIVLVITGVFWFGVYSWATQD